jgi:hypothetical protein
MTSYTEAIFQGSDVDDEFTDVVATTYRATATRTGKLWTVTVHGLPRGAVQAQGATWAEARGNALTLVVDLLQADPGTVGVLVEPADEKEAAAVAAVIEARTARALAEEAERDAVRQAAQLLVDNGWSTRDAGAVLQLSHQRISQLAPRASSGNQVADAE